MPLMRSLSGRLLILTIVFVMLAEVLIFVPSLARYREDYLRERLEAANIVAVAMERQDVAPSSGSLQDDRFAVADENDDFEWRLLDSAQVRSIAIHEGDFKRPILRGDWRDPVAMSFDIDEETLFDKIVTSMIVLVNPQPERVIRIIGAPDPERRPEGNAVQVTIKEEQLATAMRNFGIRILNLSLVISLLTASLVFLSLNRWLVRPVRRLIEAMTDFRESPEAARIIDPGPGKTELDEAGRELSAMQTEVRAALVQKTRLAELGEAVAKINHDLRNMLASAQILADRLEMSEDPMVRRVTPKLLRSLDRATDLCTRTLAFGKLEEPAPIRRRVSLERLADEVRDAVFSEGSPITMTLDMPAGIYAEADPDHLFRILQNLARNAEQAMTAAGQGNTLEIRARRAGHVVNIDVIDDGPGMPKAALDHLFKAFRGGARKGGTGLGLNIARNLARAHGGDLVMHNSTPEGTVFRLTLPDTAQ